MTIVDAQSALLSDVAPELAHVLARPTHLTPPRFDASAINVETVMVAMRDGARLATDVWLPPVLPAPVIASRTPYERANDDNVGAFLGLARRGYAVVSQDCRATGGSEPDSWDYYVYEPEDGYDLVDWIGNQEWFDGFIGACGGSYVGQTQWQMAMHPAMSTIVPEVSGLGVAINTAHLHMFANAYARSMGKGEGKIDVPYSELEGQMLDETLATGYFNEPLEKPLSDALLQRFPALREVSHPEAQRWLWAHYCSLGCADRAELIKLATGASNITIVELESLSEVFGQQISHDRHTLPHTDMAELAGSLHTPALLCTGWYDWGLNDALATWDLLMEAAAEPVRSRSRLLITPSSHNMPGYHEGMEDHQELYHGFRVPTNGELLLRWHDAVRTETTDSWPRVVYYLMGAHEWRAADAWPPPGIETIALYLGAGETLSTNEPGAQEPGDSYVYDPADPTPTVGGSIVSYVYPPGSVDVSAVQARSDVLTYTTGLLEEDLDVVGPLRLVLYASSSARDTDFAARLSDVFPDGRAVQLQNGVLRARHRNVDSGPELLEPGRTYRFEIDMWATANRFRAGHRLRVDISSADFPRLDRNTNRGGEDGPPLRAEQTIHHDRDRPSQLLLPVLAGAGSLTPRR
jgi:predicted acyl esterase